MNLAKKTVAIVGATGYTGVELLRLLANHPYVEVSSVTSRQEKGKLLTDVFPSLRGFYDLIFTDIDEANLADNDIVFFATPHTVAMKQVAKLLDKGVRVIDLSADFRLKNIAEWEQWYKVSHQTPEYIAKAVYGLVEMNREQIKTAQLVANPGCYVTAVSLPLLPLLQHQLLDEQAKIIADCKSGVSGSGRNAKIANLFCEAADNMKAYGLAGHRHYPEIRQNIAFLDAKVADNLIFVPHLVPLIRGMQATIYIQLKSTNVDLQTLFEQYYAESSCVDIMPMGSLPETRNVRGSNLCQIAIHEISGQNTYVLLSVIDNLVKGASGQAIQNMNVMLGFDERLGLEQLPMVP